MKTKPGDGWWGIGLVTIFVIGVFAGAFILMAIAVGGAFWLAFKIYQANQNSPAQLEARARLHAHQLYEAAKARGGPEFDKVSFGKGVMRHVRLNVPGPVIDAAIMASLEIYDFEEWQGEVPPPPAICNSIEGARYCDQIARMSSMDRRHVERIQRTIADSLMEGLGTITDENEGEEAFLMVPLHTHLKHHPQIIDRMILPFFSPDVKPFFTRMRAVLERNLEQHARGAMPRDYKGSGDVISTYLQDTPLMAFLNAPVPVTVPRAVRYEHAVITAGTGHGKTTLLENLILRDLQDWDYPSIVIIDSQRQLIGKLSRLAVAHERDLIIIDPKDSPALNVFAVNSARFQQYGSVEQERVRNHTLEIFNYLFDSLLGADLTVRQGALFNYLTMAMLAMPQTMGRNATLYDLIKFTENPLDYQPAIASLEPIAQEFFRTDFMRPQYNQTKEQIRYRLHAIIGNATLSRLFLAQNNAIDFFTALNSGAMILIDTDKGFLGDKNSSYLGRIAITLILRAILERDASGKPEREVFMYVDEAGEYFDRSIGKFLTEARKQRAGITFAHQDFGQVPQELRASIAANTATKYAGGGSAADARALAPDMRTTAEFILGQERLSFACYVRNVTKAAVSVSVNVGMLEREDAIGDDAYRAFRERNRERLAAAPMIAPSPPPEEPEEPKESAATEPVHRPRTKKKKKEW